MRKKFKLLTDQNKIFILKWEVDGRLFGPDWNCIATFDNVDNNLERARSIIRLMNKCDNHSE